MPEDAKNPIPGYELLSKLGEGGMGAVYKGRQVSLDRTVAVKILSPRLAKSPGYTERFLREAHIAAKLNHANIVNVIDTGSTDKYYYMVMEYVEGTTLRQIVKEKGALGEKRALQAIVQVARALAWAHGHGIIHRDVKPDNIMIDVEGTVKLCDLGLARQEDAEAAMLTQSGTMVGTPHYVSPEQARGERDLDGRTDIYSLGATLYHAVTGKPPFGGTSAAVVMTKHLTEQVPWPSEVNPAVSENLGLLIQKMMAKDRNDRYQTAGELIEDIQRVTDGKAPDTGMVDAHKSSVAGAAAAKASPRAGKAGEAARRRAPEKKKPMGLIIGIGAGVLAVILAIFLMSGPGEKPPPAQPPDGQTVVTTSDPKPDPDQPRGKAEELFEYAANWEKKHPEDYDGALERYRHVVKNAAGTVWEMKARDAIETLASKRDETAGKEFEKLAVKADALAAAGDYDGAIAVYANLPAGFEAVLKPRAGGAVAELAKAAAVRIRTATDAAEKLSAEGEPAKALARLDEVKDVKYAALSEKIAALRARLEKEKDDAAAIALGKAAAAAKEKLESAWTAFDEKIMAGDIRGAKAALRAAREDEALKPVTETIERWAGIISGFDEAAEAERKARERLKALVGTEVTLDTMNGPRKGKVTAVTEEEISLEYQAGTPGGSVWTVMKVKVADLTEKERDRLMPAAEPATADGWLAKAVAAMGTKDVAAAEAALAKAGDHSLAARYREKLDVLKLGETEALAHKAWEGSIAPLVRTEKFDEKGAETAKGTLDGYRKAHGGTKFAASKKKEMEALEDKIARAAGGAVLTILKKFYHGEIVRFDPKKLEIELAYDFENPDQVKDFFFGLDRQGRPERSSASVAEGMLDPGRGYVFALLEGVFTSVSVTVDFVALEGDRGGALHIHDNTKGGDNYYLSYKEETRLGKHVGGTHKYLCRAAPPQTPGPLKRATIRFSYADGLLKGQIEKMTVEAKDTSHTSGHVGFGQAGDKAKVVYDNLKVTGVFDRAWLEALPASGKRAAEEPR